MLQRSESATPTGQGIGAVLGSMLLAQVLVVLASLLVPVLAPLISADADAAPQFVGYFAAAIFFAAALSALPSPMLIARYGAFRITQATLLIAGAGLAVLALAPMPWAMLGSLLLGIAYGPNNPASSHLLARVTPAHLRARVFSLKQTSVPIAGVIAGAAFPLAGLALGWRWTAVSLAATCIVFALGSQPMRATMDADRRPGNPLDARALREPIRLTLRDRRLAMLGLGAAGFGALQFGFTSMFVTLLVDTMQASNARAGQALAVATATSLLARPLNGWLADRFGATPTLAATGAVMGIAAMLCSMLTPAWPWPAVLLLSAVFGAAALGWNGVYLAEVARLAGIGRVAQATGGAMVAIYFGALLGPLTAGALAGATGSFAGGFVALGAVALLAGALMSGASRATARDRTAT